jgi:hypothetical protein
VKLAKDEFAPTCHPPREYNFDIWCARLSTHRDSSRNTTQPVEEKITAMSDKPYDKMTHDEILREHGARYAQMSKEQRAEQSEARSKLERERLAAEARRLNQPLSKLTLGDLISAIEEALNKSVVPKLQEIVEAVQQIEQK